MDNSLEVVIISAIASVITLLIGKVVSSRMEKAQSEASESDAAESLSNAAKTQIEVYQKEFVTPMQRRIEELAEQLSVVEEDRYQERLKFQADMKAMSDKLEKLKSQIDFMRGELFRADTSLEYLSSIARQTYPSEVDKAIKIRRGQA